MYQLLVSKFSCRAVVMMVESLHKNEHLLYCKRVIDEMEMSLFSCLLCKIVSSQGLMGGITKKTSMQCVPLIDGRAEAF